MILPTGHKVVSTLALRFVVCCLFVGSHSDRCEVIPRGGFDLHFPGDDKISIFSCVCWPSVILLWKHVCSDPLPVG